MVSNNIIIDLLCKTLIASSINAIIFIITILLMAIVPDGNQLFIVFPLSIFAGFVVASIIKHNINTFLTVIFAMFFVIIESIVIVMLFMLVKETIKPINNFVLNIYKNASFNHFLGNFIGEIIYIILTLIVFIFSLLMSYASKP
jgi:hypothetical protein